MTRSLKPCGTEAAYQRHIANRETGCKPCRRAHADKERRANARRAGRAPHVPAGRTPYSLPPRAPEDAHKAPCTRPANGYVWDPRRDHESPAAVRARWEAAARLCMTACPVFTHCRQSRAAAGGTGVWAGQIPSRVS